jgi:flagellar motor switch protein FliG
VDGGASQLSAPARISSPEQLSGVQKCAVLCVAMGPQMAARLVLQLGPEEVDEVAHAIASLPPIDPSLAVAVLQEYESVARDAEAGVRGGVEYAELVLNEAFGAERARPSIEKLRMNGDGPRMQRLKSAPADALASMLSKEHPQTVAFVLAHLDPKQCIGVIRLLDPAMAADVLLRVARMDKTSPELVSLVESGFSGKTDLSLTHEMSMSGGPAIVAQVLNLVSGELGKQLLDEIRERNAEIATEIESKMFVFEDLVRLDKKAVQRLLRDIEGKDLALALKGASDEVKALIRTNMTERGAAALDEEIELLGAVRVKDVEAAHTRIIATVRSLESAGEIVVQTASVDDELLA